jgi:RNA polymerase sigma-70 factor (ECF subfamily)
MSEALLPRIARGDEDAVEQFVQRYERVIWWMARQYASHDPEDAVQEVFLALWQSAPKYDASKAKESTFVGMLARRKMIDRYRKSLRRPQTQDIESMPERGLAAESTVEQQAEVALVTRLISRELRPEQRSVIELSMFEGLSHREIADHTGIPVGTVKTHIRRGLMQLRSLMLQPHEAVA